VRADKRMQKTSDAVDWAAAVAPAAFLGLLPAASPSGAPQPLDPSTMASQPGYLEHWPRQSVDVQMSHTLALIGS